MHFLVSKRRRLIALSLLSSLAITIPVATAQRASDPTAIAPTKTETVEWVYRIRYGFHDEWFQIFQKYQIAILERQKQLGYVKDYTIWAPSLHTSEDSRWDYRIVITRASHDVQTASPNLTSRGNSSQIRQHTVATKTAAGSSPRTIGISPFIWLAGVQPNRRRKTL